MARRNHRTLAERQALQERQDEAYRQTDEASAQLRWNVFVDTMIEIAAIVASDGPQSDQTSSQ